MTAMGVPGVYTFDFYDGWAPNYMFWIANMRNSIGRFYETQAARNASNYILNLNVDRQWHRPNTPLRQVVWSIRNNVNLQQSGLLIAMKEVADNRVEYLNNFYVKSQRSVAKARAEGPAAYVFPASDVRIGQQAAAARADAAPRPRGAPDVVGRNGGRARHPGGQLRDPHGPAVLPCRGHDAGPAILQPERPAPL
jgi:hypothetical protein